MRLRSFVQRPSALMAIGLLWFVFIGAGMYLLQREEFTPASPSSPLAQFPSGSAIPCSADKPTLVVFAHPRCPCTRATFAEVAELAAAANGKLAIVTVFTLPPGVARDWVAGELLQMAKALPARVVLDQGGVEAARFKVKASGTVLLYAPAGQLLFSGGLTSSRGQEGESLGRDAVLRLVLTERPSIIHTPVFGCSLL